MLSLDRFQSCFNSLKKWNKITIYILDSWQVLCVLTAPAKSKKVFIQLCHGSLECWKCERCQNVLTTMTYSTWRQERIMLMYWCKGSYNSPFYLKKKSQNNKNPHDNTTKHTSPERGSILLSTKPSDMFQELSVHQIAFQHVLGEGKKKRQISGVLLAFLGSYCFCEIRMVVQFRCWEGLPKSATGRSCHCGRPSEMAGGTLSHWVSVPWTGIVRTPTWLYVQYAAQPGTERKHYSDCEAAINSALQLLQ